MTPRMWASRSCCWSIGSGARGALTRPARCSRRPHRHSAPEHPDTLTARANLASSYGQAGRTTDAIALQETVLTDRERLLGPEHPDTLTARNDLALSYWQAGRTTDAITLHETVLTDRERVLGPEHPDTLTARNNLALSYWQAGRTTDAITLQETVLTDLERVLGPDTRPTPTPRLSCRRPTPSTPRGLLRRRRAHRLTAEAPASERARAR